MYKVLIKLNLFSKNIYVSKIGNDTNTGTTDAPFLTIQKGINEALAGNRVLIGNGTY
ncbi:DUF1565 domain-containing protein [Aquimarina aggregata]|uniref:DUF1565 domain-containing protein n=1 Tax=Aquimarina aggregata TaxID=1642818 RepID=UPI0012FE58ED